MNIPKRIDFNNLKLQNSGIETDFSELKDPITFANDI